MKRKVIGYDKTLEYLRNGYELVDFPTSASNYIYDKETKQYITVRYDVLMKLFRNGIKLKERYEFPIKYYSLKEDL